MEVPGCFLKIEILLLLLLSDNKIIQSRLQLPSIYDMGAAMQVRLQQHAADTELSHHETNLQASNLQQAAARY